MSSFSSGDNPVERAGCGRERLAATYARPGELLARAVPKPEHQTEKLVRTEKRCVSEDESPSSMEARFLEFRTKVMNGKV